MKYRNLPLSSITGQLADPGFRHGQAGADRAAGPPRAAAAIDFCHMLESFKGGQGPSLLSKETNGDGSREEPSMRQISPHQSGLSDTKMFYFATEMVP